MTKSTPAYFLTQEDRERFDADFDRIFGDHKPECEAQASVEGHAPSATKETRSDRFEGSAKS